MSKFALLYSFAEFGKNAESSLLDSLLGMGVVFAVLAVLWGTIELFRVLYTAADKKLKARRGDPSPVPEAPAAPEQDGSATQPEAGADDTEQIVAAISAALSEYIGAPQSSFRVVSFRRKDEKGPWNRR